MRRDGRDHRAWQRQREKPPSSALDPPAVFNELQKRSLKDVEHCRVAWEQEGDPLAICAAVIHCDLPSWLKDALLVQLTDGVEPWPTFRKKAWRDRKRDAIDSVRAAEIANLRSHPARPQTWEKSYELAKHFLAESDLSGIPDVDDEALKKSFQRVSRGLRAPGRYYAAPKNFHAKVQTAWVNFLALMTAAVERGKESR